MKFNLAFILSLSCTIPAAIGLCKLKRVDKKFHPFIYAMVMALLAEVLFRIAVNYKWPLQIRFGVYNLYLPISSFLYLLFFKRNDIISSKLMWLLFTLVLISISGTAIYLSSISEFFRFPVFISYGIISILSVNLLTNHITGNSKKGDRNFYLIMSNAAIVMCVFFIFIGSYSYLATKDIFFRKTLFSIQPFINAACYLSFAWSILCIPKIKI